MDPITIGLIAMGVGGAVKAIGGFMDNTGDLMRQQAQLKLDTLTENMRRTEGQQTQVLSSTKARMAATGFASDSGSFTDFIKTLGTEFDRQNAATMKLGQKSADLLNQGADAADTAKYIGAITGAVNSGLGFAGLVK